MPILEQSGNVTPGHLVAWVTDGVVGDGGTSVITTSSVTSLTIGTGNNTLYVATGILAFQTGQYVAISLSSAPTTTYMSGTVVSYDLITGQLVVNVGVTLGSGTYAVWTVSVSLNAAVSAASTAAALSQAWAAQPTSTIAGGGGYYSSYQYALNANASATTCAAITGSPSVVAVYNNLANINIVAGSIAAVAATGNSIVAVKAIYTSIAAVTAVAADLANVDIVGASISNVNNVGSNIANVNTAATNIANINTAATNIANINTAATSIANINAVAGSIANVNTVATNIASVNTVGTVATNIANVNNVGASIANVNTVATNIASVNTVAASITNVNTCAASIAAVVAAPTYAANASASAVSAANYAAALNATSANTLTIAATPQSFTIQTGKQFVVGEYVIVSPTTTPAYYMTGAVTSYTSGTGAIVVNVANIGGSGTFSSWTISPSGVQGPTGAMGASGFIPIGAAGGTVDAITVTIGSTSTVNYQIINVVCAGSNTSTTPTLKLNSDAAYVITTRGGSALIAGDIGAAGFVGAFEYNSANTRWELQNPVGGTAATKNTGTSGATVPLLNGANTWSGVQTFTNSDLLLLGSSTGATTFTSANAGAANYTITVPAATATLAGLGIAQTWTAAQTFTNSDLLLLGSSTGATTFTSANAGASNYTITVPAATATLAGLGIAQTWTAAQTFTNSDLLLLGSSTGATTFTSANAGASNYTITVPAATDTVVLLAASQNLTGKTYNGLTVTTSAGTLAVADNASASLTTVGNYATTLTSTAATNSTLPAGTHTLAGLDVAQAWAANQYSPPVTLTDAATVAWAMSGGTNFEVVLGGARTLGVPTAGAAGQTGYFNVIQDTTGSRTLAYSWCYTFAGGTAPVLTTTALGLDLLSYQVSRFQAATVTMTIATPGVVTYTSHGLKNGDIIQLTTSGALPTGLTASTPYWVANVAASTFNLSTSKANAAAGTYIATSGSQSGTHTCTCITVQIAAAKDFR